SFVTVVLVLLSRTTFADSATWNSSGSSAPFSPQQTDWNTNGNWAPTSGYPGTTAEDTATFDNLSNVTPLVVSASPPFPLAAITFTASEKHVFVITVNPTVFLTISGTGITDYTVGTQTFFNTGNAAGNGGIIFTGSATAGNSTAGPPFTVPARFTNSG